MDSVKTRPVANSHNEMEFDFIHPHTNKRVRRKIKITPSNAEMVCKLLDVIIEHNHTLDEIQRTIFEDPLYMDSADFFIKTCKTLYFDYNIEQEYIDYESEVTMKLNKIFIDIPDINISFLGKAGVGKSSIIRKMSTFSDTNINFPFVDTSRTSTYSAEYCFSPEKHSYQFAVAFMNEVSIINRLEECIERGINKAISQFSKDNDKIDSLEDQIITAFYTDPAQIFDIRLCFGKHIKKTSKNYGLDKNRTIVDRWNQIVKSCKDIAGILIGYSTISESDISFYQEKFSEFIKSEKTNEIQELYKKLVEYVKEQVAQEKATIIKAVENNPCIRDIEHDSDVLSCRIIEFSTESFKNFISVFTSKNIESFGNSLLPLTYKMRIELPYNSKISDVVKAKKIRCFDTVGIAHTTDTKGGFEKSTQLKLENIDGIIIADDSRLNMSNDTGVIIKHISARVDYRKIYFALTFFDEFSKEQFDPDEDINEQKIDYLLSIQKEKITEYLEESNYSKSLVERVQKSAIFYLSGLKYSNTETFSNGYLELNQMLDQIRKNVEISKNKNKVCKVNPSLPIVKYDYKKLSILYSLAYNEFNSLQRDLYFNNPPHFKTTEALTRRLKEKETCFYGARILKPVDDLYNSLITQLDEFITEPLSVNLTGEEPDDVELVIGELKSFITDKISTLIKQRFFTEEMIDKWKKLWLDSGSGVDYRRRQGIINTENLIAPTIEAYLKANSSTHLVDELEVLINECILEFEKNLKERASY